MKQPPRARSWRVYSGLAAVALSLATPFVAASPEPASPATWERDLLAEGGRNLWHGHGATSAIAISKDNLTIASLGGETGGVLALEARTGRVFAVHFPNPTDWMRFDSYGRGSSLCSLDGSKFLVLDGRSKRLEIANFGGASGPHAADSAALVAHLVDVRGEIQCSAICAPNSQVAAATRDVVTLVAFGRATGSVSITEPFVQALGYCSDGSRVVTTRWNNDGDLFRIWSSGDGSLLGSIKVPPRSEYVDGSRFIVSIPNSSFVVAGGWRSGVVLIDVRANKVAADLTGTSIGVTGAAASPSGDFVVLGHQSGDVRIVDLHRVMMGGSAPTELWNRSDGSGAVHALAWGGDPRVVQVAIAGGGWRSLRVDDAAARVEVDVVRRPVRLAAVGAGKGDVVLAGGGQELWVRSKGAERVAQLPIGAVDAVVGLAVSPERGRLVVSTRSGRIFFSDSSDGEFVEPPPSDRSIGSISVAADGTRAFALARTGEVFEWTTKAGSPAKWRTGGLDLECSSISEDGLAIAYVDKRLPTRLVLSRRSGPAVRAWEESSVECDYPIHCCCMSPSGRFIAAGDGEFGVVIWDPRSHVTPVRLTGHERRVNAVAFSNDERTLASGGDDLSVRLWDVGRGMEVGLLSGNWTAITSVAISRDDHRIVAGGIGGDVCVWRRRP